jgi:CrcB protein
MTGTIPNDALAIGAGAFFGAMSRHQAGRLASEWIAVDPNRLGRYQGWHTAAINVGGSFLLGGVTGAPLVSGPSQPGSTPSVFGLTPRTKLMLGVGFCGSFTTFSTFSVDIATWLAQGQTTKAASYILANNVGGIVAASAGMLLVKKLFG